MKHLLIIANPSKTSFSHGMAEKYKEKIEAEGGEYKILDLYDVDQEFLYYASRADLYAGNCNGKEKMKEVQEKIAWADEMSFFFPVWWGSMPAILKNFFDVNFSSGFAFKYVKGKKMPEKLLTGKTAKIFCSCDAPGFIYKISFIIGISLKKYMSSAILDFCGVKVTEYKLIDSLRAKTEDQRKQILDSIAGK